MIGTSPRPRCAAGAVEVRQAEATQPVDVVRVAVGDRGRGLVTAVPVGSTAACRTARWHRPGVAVAARADERVDVPGGVGDGPGLLPCLSRGERPPVRRPSPSRATRRSWPPRRAAAEERATVHAGTVHVGDARPLGRGTCGRSPSAPPLFTSAVRRPRTAWMGTVQRAGEWTADGRGGPVRAIVLVMAEYSVEDSPLWFRGSREDAGLADADGLASAAPCGGTSRRGTTSSTPARAVVRVALGGGP